MSRHVLLVPALVALCTLGLAGCGGSDSATDSGSTRSSSTASSPRAAYSAPADDGNGPCQYPANQRIPAARKVVTPPTHPDVSGTVTATMDTSVGALTLALDADNAPCTVNSFVALAKQGYFDATTCHRLTEGEQTGIAVLQCGDPTGTGAGGPGYTIPDELTGNTGEYPPGTLAMANTGQPGTGGSQFFIVYGESQLGPSYTIFGTIDDAGLKAVEKVAADGTDDAHGLGDGAPKTPVDISSVAIS